MATVLRSVRDTISRISSFLGKGRAIRRFLTVLPRRLLQDYGHRGPYTPAQVASTIRRWKISPPRYVAYALAIFCNRASLDQLDHERGRPHQYEDIRAEIGQAYFGGDSDFTIRDIGRFWVEHGGEGSADAHSTHNGIHHDGGGGHH